MGIFYSPYSPLQHFVPWNNKMRMTLDQYFSALLIEPSQQLHS